jgi:hypothetical protein
MRAFITIGWAVVAACTTPQESQPFHGTLPKGTHLEMAGTFTFSPEGELQLALAKPCTMERRHDSAIIVTACDRTELDTIRISAHTPWNQDIPGTWSDAAHVTFRSDWKTSGIDPLADDVRIVVAGPWMISGTQWHPTPMEAEAILKLVSVATETELEVVQGEPPPRLEVTNLEAEGGTLHTGESNMLVVRITNRGSGTAYRVVATTRSSVEALRGRRLSFGSIRPGASKVRQLKVTLPASETAPDTMLVLELSEGNGVTPPNVSRRISIAPSLATPLLAVHCTIVGHDVLRPDLDAGQQLMLRCAVVNNGDAAAPMVDLEASVASGAPVHTRPQAIAVSGHAMFDIPVTVPHGIPIDASVEIAIVAHDRRFSHTASTKVVGVVRKPRLCVAGQLTDAQYRAKLTEMRAAVAAGDLTQAQLDRYDAELVTCLK